MPILQSEALLKEEATTLRHPGGARRGIVWATIATCLIAALVGGFNLKSGFGLWADLLFALLAAAGGVALVALAVALFLKLLRKLPRGLSGLLAGAFFLLALPWLNRLGYALAAIVLLIECVLGAAIATAWFGGLRYATLRKKTVIYGAGALAIAANIGLVTFLRADGVSEKLLKVQHSQMPLPRELAAPDPSLPGPYAVKTLFYGRGDDLHRPEYGNTVAIRTNSVDATPFFKDFGGWKAYLRRHYWGFGMDRLPLNGRVWYPAGAGPFPLVLMVHGNHTMAEFSDPGYGYLGELLASRGFIFVSMDENFLNVGLFHQPPEEQPARGWLMLEHLKLWHAWNAAAGNPFYGKVDLANTALAGHSRGGEAAATAALFNRLAYDPDDASIRFHYNFPIKSVIAIAPSDGQYQPAGQWRVLEDINYLTIQGANDADVSSFVGSRQWDHVRFSGTGDYFKAELYVYRANHGQFNTVWGRHDITAPQSWFLNTRPLLSGDEQRRIAKVYFTAFLESTLHNRHEYDSLFRDYRYARDWLPDTLYVNRYLNASDRVVSDFSEDSDLTSTTVAGGHLEGRHLALWREGKIPFRNGDRGYNGVFLGWNEDKPNASYSLTVPGDLAKNWKLDGASALTLSVAATSNEGSVTDFSVAVESADGVRVELPSSAFMPLPPPIEVRFTKLAFADRMLYKDAAEPIFQSIEIPLQAFVSVNGRFVPEKLTKVSLVFDRSKAGELVVSRIGFSGH